jgi:hypothetical protein
MWDGLLAPSGMPQPVIARIHNEVFKLLVEPNVRQSMEREELTPVGSAPQVFGDRLKSETAGWAKVVKASISLWNGIRGRTSGRFLSELVKTRGIVGQYPVSHGGTRNPFIQQI